MTQAATDRRTGLAYAVLAYLAWGVLPAYWHLVKSVPALEILCHRIVWSLVFVGALLVVRGRVGEVRAALADWRRVRVLLASALLIAVNWLIYIWAVNNGRVLESSLGYFINPLVSVLLGTAVLRERLRPAQWAGMALAAVGVGTLAVRAGDVPWLSLALALTFALYGLLRKTAAVDSLTGLSIESLVLGPFAAAYLVYAETGGAGAFVHGAAAQAAVLAGAGVVTALPLLWFAHAARRLPLSTIGVLQYLAPTCQFLLAVLVFGEPLTPAHQVAFGCIWLGLLVFTLRLRRADRPAPSAD